MSTENQSRDIEIVHHFFDKNNVRGGLGLLALYTPGDSFIRVTTEPCSKQDQYSKKTALFLLKDNMENGQYIRLPFPSHLRRNTKYAHVRNYLLTFDCFSSY